MKRLVLVRHGESVWNAQGRIQGQQCAGLSEVGRAQAEATANALAECFPTARLFASDLQRTMETASPLSKLLGRDVVPDARLRERSFGAWEGRLRTDVIDADSARWQRWLAGEDVIAEVGGESAEQLSDRVEGYFRSLLASTEPNGTTVAVTHGGTVWHGTHRLLDLLIPSLGGVSNASVAEILDVGAGCLIMGRWNEIGHLPVDLRTAGRPVSRRPDGPPVGR